MIFVVLSLLSALTSADAVAVVLNSRNATGARTFAEAKEIVERDARNGKPLQQYVVGVTTDDKELAEKYLTASREKIRNLAEKTDNPLAWYLLSMEKNDFSYLKRAADGGNLQALNAYGTINMQEALRCDNITTNRLDEILKSCMVCFQKAAAKKDPNGYINLGTCYQRGLGCRQDLGLAFLCFKAAADAGHPEGMDYVSACYQFGHGVPKDSKLSLEWAMRGRVARGDKAAAEWLEKGK